MKFNKPIIIMGVVVIVSASAWSLGAFRNRTTQNSNSNSVVLNKNLNQTNAINVNQAANANSTVNLVVFPINDFLNRITKKRFGQYITPQNSPVQPERFSGYHTAVDLEATEAEQTIDVPVYSMADGEVVSVRNVDGYGGVIMIRYEIEGEIVTALYGHVRFASVSLTAGERVTKGEQIAVLGTGFTAETDGERKHLHFGLLKGASTNVRGYVSTQAELTAWLDPAEWLEERVR